MIFRQQEKQSRESFISAVVDVYDGDTGLWSTETLSLARYDLAAVTIDNKAYFVGGDDGSDNSDVMDIYDADLNLWSNDTTPMAILSSRGFL